MNNFDLGVGCLAGGTLECVNGGQCLSNGVCECKIGFSGTTCSNCKRT